jgi:hypothetical protein
LTKMRKIGNVKIEMYSPVYSIEQWVRSYEIKKNRSNEMIRLFMEWQE